ncbi:PREDICTED: uncharacterized protein LOC105448679 [Wasmannia auropunctata]|uniref:uncharacterized protein LOC105448679 n=1 Tax=Wasmannia auropunctata TaxID=64793 RepID=UPI0005F00385|nr:PREDICTED: uncharacterized protein LOC105448679 [Wasmannia auropunctata]
MIPPNDYMEVEVAHEEDDQELMEIEEDFSDDSSNDSGMDNEVIELERHGLLYPDDVYDLHITDVMCMLEFYYIDEEHESDVQTPLLRTVPLDIESYVYGSIKYKSFSTGRYIPLLHTALQTIEIDIRDEFGHAIPFEYGTLTRAVVNVQSIDNACFAWSVVAALYPAKNHVDRESSYPHYKSVLNLKDIEFPMTLSQIKKFENLNAISINVYTIENVEQVSILPIRLANTKKEKHVNLLYVEKDGVGHFTWIKNLSRLVSSQLSKKKNKKYICDRCLHYFSSSEKLEVHTVDCGEMNECAIRLPSEDNKRLTSAAIGQQPRNKTKTSLARETPKKRRTEYTKKRGQAAIVLSRNKQKNLGVS